MKNIITGIIITLGTLSLYGQVKPVTPAVPTSTTITLSEVDSLKFQLAQSQLNTVIMQAQATLTQQVTQQVQNTEENQNYQQLIKDLSVKYKAKFDPNTGKFTPNGSAK